MAKKTKAAQATPKAKASEQASEKATPGKLPAKPVKKAQGKAAGAQKPTQKPVQKTVQKSEAKKPEVKKAPAAKAVTQTGSKPKLEAKADSKLGAKTGSKPVKAPAKQAKPEAAPAMAGSTGVKRLSAGRVAEGVKRGPRPKYIPPHVAKALSGHQGPLTDEELRQVKTGLTKDDLKRYRQLLLDRRVELMADMESMQRESRSSQESSNLSSMPVHMADIGSDNYDQERTLGLIEKERKQQQEIEEAIQRIDSGTYGVCLETGQPIGKARLDAKPWAKYTIEVAREKERRGES